ncbi:glycoside hydrolase family 3 protein [Streptomyces sp. N2-109]|uniref:beta-N-acetylhexosaminidase n=1 Tax=Streptomyces gossypii TaxID=2883101 RepID=A0ABT2K0N9_9ACTN|nr:glycoside hydrolase family 3 protein [Streptomyces gossypii]MCT2593110.1 glycoside hydrolase family 3 protein [Streptomyces gossypii]
MQQPTRRQALTGAAGAAAGLGIAGAVGSAAATGSGGADGPYGSGGSAESVRRKVSGLLRRMSLEEKLGQLFVVEVYGQGARAAHAKNRELYGVDTPAEILAKYRPGGVIYFDARRGPDNVSAPRQAARLSNGLQRESRIPLVISTDQEGGSVVYRLTEPATALPGNMALAASRSTRDVHDAARIIGTELAAVGINQNYAPVADVNINPANPVIGIRSFSSDPDLVSDLVSSAVRGYHRGQVASAAKHFPGHGDTDTDSHYGLPVIKHTRAELDRIDLPPFRAAIRRGVDTVMTAHIVVPALDPTEVPATMSHPIVTGLLRQELGFDGLIVTDALDMQGAAGEFPPDVAPVRALEAGCDQLVLAPEMDVAFAAVLAAVRSGRITEDRIDESVGRVLTHKVRRGLFPFPYVSEARAERTLGKRSHLSDARQITDRTITLVKNDGVLPLAASESRSVLVTGWGATTTRALAEAIGARAGQSAEALETGTAPTRARIDAVVAAAGGKDLVLVSANAAAAGKEDGVAQAALVEALLATGVPVVVAAVRNPYDIRRFTDVPAYLASYSYGAPSLDALVRALYGELEPSGRLPVAIPALDDPEETLYRFGHGLRY